MWVKSSGMLSENVFHVTTPVSTHALVVGELAALVDTAVTAVFPRIQEQLNACLGEGEELNFVLLT
ncbi:MAG: hypothetical protein GX589_09410, partial [Deltaproteobacteria bacterium]|nr:hypothetical protein [Deltaproteobacteria bacterium]